MIDYVLATLGFIASVITIIGFVYAFLRNFKIDINKHIDEIKQRQDLIDDRMFLLATGKSLSEALKEERMKKEEKK